MDDQEADRSIDELLSYQPAPEDSLMRFRREALETEARRAAAQVQSSAELNQQRTAQWETWATAIIRRELAEQNKAIGEVISEVRAELRQEFAELLAEYGRRGDETVKQLRAEAARAKAHDAGQVLDLPALPLRKRHDAA